MPPDPEDRHGRASRRPGHPLVARGGQAQGGRVAARALPEVVTVYAGGVRVV